MAATEDGDGFCAHLDVFLGAKLEATEGGDGCCIDGELDAPDQTIRSLGAAAVPPFDFEPETVAAIARLCLGPENKACSSKDELRFGNRGSVAVKLSAGVWHDHENECGGGILDLIETKKGHKGRDAIKWAREQGFAIGDEPEPKPHRRIIAKFDYVDEAGRLLFQVVRYEPKDFRQRHPDPRALDGYEWNIKGVRRVPYRLPELLIDVAAGKTILIPEGEKQVDFLRSWGFAATCNAMGTGKWKGDHSEFLRGAEVVILPDNDEAGRDHANKVAASLIAVGATVRVLELPGLGPKGDILDWAKIEGSDEVALDDLIEHEARQWEPPKPGNSDARHKGESVRQGEQKQPKFPLIAWQDITFEPEGEWRVEGVFPRVGLACLYGGPGAVKTFILLDLFNRMASGGLWGGRDVKQSPVIYIAAEGANGIKKRIAAIKQRRAKERLSADVPFYLITVAPNLGTGEGDLKELVANITAVGIQPGAIAIDTTAQSIGGADENTTGMGQLVANATALVNHFSCLVVLVHHVPLSDEERLRGGTALIGALDVSILSKREKGSLIATLSIKKMKDDDEEQSFTAHLIRVVLGQTKSGREISTLIVESVEPGDAEVGSDTGKKLASCAINALSALRYTLDEVGAVPPASNHIPGGQKCVSLDQWRTYAYLRSDLDLKDSKKKELSRGIAILRARKLVGIWEAYAWET